jgi:hypothetical protein
MAEVMAALGTEGWMPLATGIKPAIHTWEFKDDSSPPEELIFQVEFDRDGFVRESYCYRLKDGRRVEPLSAARKHPANGPGDRSVDHLRNSYRSLQEKLACCGGRGTSSGETFSALEGAGSLSGTAEWSRS